VVDTPLAEHGADRIVAARLEKLAHIEASGGRAYPTTYARSHVAAEVHAQYERLEGSTVSVAGRIGVFRTFGKNLAFVTLEDGSGTVQLMLHPREMSESARLAYETP
jgi:lysyl-tRNA synthetase class II